MHIKREKMFVLGLLLSGLILTACSGSVTGDVGTTDVSVLTIDDIPLGYTGPIVHDVTPSGAWVRFDTGVPTVCNMAYGPTTEYGRVATLPMADGPTLDHDLQVFNLEPGTTYHYLFTLVDERGNVYRSVDFTFNTPTEAEFAAENEGQDNSIEPEGENISAQASVVDVSSNWNGGDNDSSFGANNAIDGDMSSEWSSDGDGNDAYITLDLGQQHDLSTIGFATRTMGTSAEIGIFTVTNENGEIAGPFSLTAPNEVQYFAINLSATTLRFDVESSSGGNTGAVEIELYASGT